MSKILTVPCMEERDDCKGNEQPNPRSSQGTFRHSSRFQSYQRTSDESKERNYNPKI